LASASFFTLAAASFSALACPTHGVGWGEGVGSSDGGAVACGLRCGWVGGLTGHDQHTFSVTEAGCVEGGGGWSGVWRMRGVGVRAGEGVRAQKEAVC
jgi:hypothetical protein